MFKEGDLVRLTISTPPPGPLDLPPVGSLGVIEKRFSHGWWAVRFYTGHACVVWEKEMEKVDV